MFTVRYVVLHNFSKLKFFFIKLTVKNFEDHRSEMDYRSKFCSTDRNNKSYGPKSVIVAIPYKSVTTVRSSMIRL